MTIDQFRERMATGEPIVGGSDLHLEFHKYSQEALRITAEINGSYHASSTTMRSSGITLRSARSITSPTRLNGQA